jgi:hypothetical protein
VSFDEVLFTPAVLYYTVEFKPSAFSGWASVQIPGTSVTLTKALHGVEDFIDYDVRVFATNANGDGVRSAIFVEQSLPPQTPQDPTDLEGRGVGVEVIYKPWGV